VRNWRETITLAEKIIPAEHASICAQAYFIIFGLEFLSAVVVIRNMSTTARKIDWGRDQNCERDGIVYNRTIPDIIAQHQNLKAESMKASIVERDETSTWFDQGK
jgi:hypothetical protein